MNEDDAEWILEWFDCCRKSMFKVEEEIDPPEEVIESAEGEENVRGFILGYNQAVEDVLHRFGEKFYNYQGKEIEEVEEQLPEMEKQVQEIEDEELKEELMQDIKETRQNLESIKRNRENFLKPIYEEDEG